MTACQDSKSTTSQVEDVQTAIIDSVSIDTIGILPGLSTLKILSLPPKVQRSADSWQYFTSLDRKMEGLLSVNRPRLISYVEETEILYNEMSEIKFPNSYNVPQIKSRFLVYRTMLLKLKDHADDPRYTDEELVQEITATINAYNDVKQQMIELSLDDLDTDQYINPGS